MERSNDVRCTARVKFRASQHPEIAKGLVGSTKRFLGAFQCWPSSGGQFKYGAIHSLRYDEHK